MQGEGVDIAFDCSRGLPALLRFGIMCRTVSKGTSLMCTPIGMVGISRRVSGRRGNTVAESIPAMRSEEK